MKYLFWNTHKNIDINPILRDLITENCISIVVLAEYTADINDLIRLLYDSGVIMEHIPTVGCDRIHILGRIDFHIEPQLQTDYASIQVIGRDTILCCVHLNSQIYSDHVSRREIVIEQIINDILKLENGLNTTNSISDHLPITFEIKEDYHEQNT